MYTENDLTAIKAQISRRWVALLVPFGLLLIGVIVGAVLRQEVLTEALTVAAGFLFIAGYDLGIHPLKCYERHLDDVLHGITHDLDCIYSGISDETSTVSGVNYRTLTVICRDDKDRPYDRTFYYDSELPKPEIAAGTAVRVTYHDHELGALTVLA